MLLLAVKLVHLCLHLGEQLVPVLGRLNEVYLLRLQRLDLHLLLANYCFGVFNLTLVRHVRCRLVFPQMSRYHFHFLSFDRK